MTTITLTEARAHLADWLAADTAVSKKQSYSINNRQLTKADASLISEKITFWRREVVAQEAAARGAKSPGIVTATFKR